MNGSGLNIIKSPEAQRMRAMVTSGFYDRSLIGLWMFEVIGREYDDMNRWSHRIILEAFPQTCTWSIGIWEWIYGIESDDKLTLDFRRGRVLAKRLDRLPISPARMERILLVLTGAKIMVKEDVASYTFAAELNSTTEKFDYLKIWQAIRRVKPSHLSFNFIVYKEPLTFKIYYLGGVTWSKVYNISGSTDLTINLEVEPKTKVNYLSGVIESKNIDNLGSSTDLTVNLEAETTETKVNYLSGVIESKNIDNLCSSTDLTVNLELETTATKANYLSGVIESKNIGNLRCSTDLTVNLESETTATKVNYLSGIVKSKTIPNLMTLADFFAVNENVEIIMRLSMSVAPIVTACFEYNTTISF